jgi:hypothetical protein
MNLERLHPYEHLLLSPSMAHTLLQRIHFDDESEWSNFLLNATYDKDFVPTRDSSIGYGSLWIFKQCKEDAENDPTDVRRGHLMPYMAQVFGEIDAIESLVRIHHFSPCFAVILEGLRDTFASCVSSALLA